MAIGTDARSGVDQGLARRSMRWPRRAVAWATLGVIGAGLAWRIVRYLLAFPLWGDEAFVAVTVLERDLVGLARPPEFFQIVPPGFLAGEWLAVRWLGPGERALRLIPLVASVAALLLFWRFCRAVATRRTTLLAVAILAASFYPVRHAVEVKPYSTDLLISLMLTCLGWAVFRRIDSTARWLGLNATAVVGVWWSYPSVFPAAAVGMLLACRRPTGRAAWFFAAYALSLIASWIPMYLLFAGPQAKAAPFLTQLVTWRGSFPPIAQPWRIPWWLLRVHTGFMVAYPQGGNHFGSTATALLVMIGVVRIWRRRARRPLLLLLLGPLAPALVAAALQRYPYGTSTRVMLYMAPAFCLLAAEGLMAIFRARHRPDRGPIATAGVLAVVCVLGLARDVVWPYTGIDNVLHRRRARQLAALAEPVDEYVVFNGVTPPPELPDLMITRWLQRVAVARYELGSLVPTTIRWHPDPNTVQPRPGGRVWLIVQRHGDERFFSEQQLADDQAALADRFGTPQFFGRYRFPNGETWTIWAYPKVRAAGP